MSFSVPPAEQGGNDSVAPRRISPDAYESISPAGTVVLLLSFGGRRQAAAERALELSKRWAAAGRRIVLADLHLDQPLLHAGESDEAVEGIVDVFLYGASLSRIARPFGDGGFYLIPAGTYAPDPGEIYRHPRWPKVIAGFRNTGATLLLFVPGESRDLGDLRAWGTEAIALTAPPEPNGHRPLAAAGIELIGVVDDGRGDDAEPDSEDGPRDQVVGSAASPDSVRVGPTQRGGASTPELRAPTADAGAATPGAGSTTPDAGAAPPEVVAAAPDVGSPTPETGSTAAETRATTPEVGPAAPEVGALTPEAGSTAAEVGAGAPGAVASSPAVAVRTPAETTHGALDDLELPPPPARRPGKKRRTALIGLLVLGVIALTVAYLIAALRASGGDTRSPSGGEFSPTASPEGEVLDYSVHVKAFITLSAARTQLADEQRRLPSVPFFISPEEIQGVLYYRVMAGFVAGDRNATRLRTRLVEAGAVSEEEAIASSLLEFTPMAYDLGEFATREAAMARADSLLVVAIPSYAVVVPYSDGTRRWKLYGGAFRDSWGADRMAEMLRAAGLPQALTIRHGDASPPSE